MGWLGKLFSREQEPQDEGQYAENGLRVAAVDNPLDVREDRSILPGDSAYDFMMEVLHSESGVGSTVQRKDGTWETTRR